MNESSFRQQVIDLLKLFGWRYYFTWNSIHSPAGFPDIVAIREKRLIFAELKGTNGELTAEQYEWLYNLQRTIWQEAYVWKPEDFNEIEECLK
jgi:hypothetical protein